MDKLYMSPITLSELGKSDHNMVLLKPGGSLPCTVEPLLYDHPQNHIGVVV